MLPCSVQNQTLLEEELGSAQTKLKLAQETLESNKHMQTEYHTLVAERKEWMLLFQNILREQGGQQQGGRGNQDGMNMNHASTVATNHSKKTTTTGATPTTMPTFTSAEINPTMVLRTLSDTQKQCVVLLKQHGELESTVTELKKQLQIAESLATSSMFFFCLTRPHPLNYTLSMHPLNV